MGEERVPTGFELSRANAREMLERTSPSDPTTQAMGDVAESVNSMDLATRDLLGKITRRLEELANTASAASSEQAKALEQSAKDAAERFGEVYTAVGGVTAEDIEGLTENLSKVVAEGAPPGVETEAGRVRESAQEFASTIQEASSRLEETARVTEATTEEQVEVLAGVRGLGEVPVGERAVVEAQQAQLELLRSIDQGVTEMVEAAPRPRDVPEGVEVSRRVSREGRVEQAEKQKGLFRRLGKGIVGGFEKVYKSFLPDFMTQIGFLVGGLYAVKDELLLGLKVGWDTLADTYNETKSWWQQNWRDVPGMLWDLAVDVGVRVKDGLVWLGEWLWEKMPAIKGWIKDGLKATVLAVTALPRLVVEGVRTWWSGREAVERMKEQAEVRRAQVRAIPAGVPRRVYEEARAMPGVSSSVAMALSGLAERDPAVAAEAFERFKTAMGRGASATTAQREAFAFARERGGEARAVESPMGGVTVAGERDLQVRAATAAAGPSEVSERVVSLIQRQFELQQEMARRGPGTGEMPAFFDGPGPPDDQGMLLLNAGLAGGGIQ